MSKSSIKYYFLFLVVFLSTQLKAQRCEWLEVGGGAGNEVGWVICTDNDNNILVSGTFDSSFTLNTFNFNNPITAKASAYLIKYSEDGSILWGRAIESTCSSTIITASVKTDNDNNIYLTGRYCDSLDFGSNIILSKSGNTNSEGFLAKYDSSGVIQWATSTSTVNGGGFGLNSELTIDSDNNIYWGFSYFRSIGFLGTTKTFSSKDVQIGVAKYTTSGSFINAVSIGGDSLRDDFLGMGMDSSNTLYILGYSNESFMFGLQQLSGKGEIILKLDSALNPKKGKKINIGITANNPNFGGYPSGFGIAVQDNGKFVVISNIYDSVYFGNNVWLKSPWSYTNIVTNSTVGIVFYNSDINPIWARKNDAIGQAKPQVRLSMGVVSKNNNIYFGGNFRGNGTKFGIHTFKQSVTYYQPYWVKMDTVGNFLWLFQDTGVGTLDIAADNNGHVYLTGAFLNSISIFNKNAQGFGKGDFFVAKIEDYTITRGFVSSGPYCAGDTIDIPYTKYGRYDTGNFFIAELSDSAGNFEGGHRELGRLKDTATGVIKGTLPLFNVATTNKYRIRILSTDPVVQSYYRIDTLRLLIYSKDTANVGADRTVCKQERIQLTTTGGSKWQWTPTAAIENQDSSNRYIWIRPDTTTEYRIIISDSSGCGDVDTDFVKINVRPYIETKIVGDSQICRGLRQTLQTQTTGGDSSQYWYQWKLVSLNIGVGKNASLFIRPANTTEYMVIVGDSCSDKIDTTYFTVNVQNNLKANPSPDTTICKGKTAQLSVIGTGCNPNKYTYEWIEKGNSTILSTNDSITVTPNTTTQYQVILKDTSTLLIDTATITVTVDSIFNITTLQDSAICQGQTIDLTAFVFSCDTSTMTYTWDNGLGQGKTKTINPTVTTTYTVIGENTFNKLKDTAQVTITVRDPLSLTLNTDSTICIGEQAELRAIATGGRNTTYSIQWTANNSPITNNLITQVNPTTTTTYKALLSDGCTVNNDSAEITITVRPKLEITVNQDSTICIGEAAELRAIPTGGLATAHQIQWFTNSQQLSANNNIKITPTVTTTYKAVLSDGCTTPKDSATITITVRPKLSLILNTDSTICIGEQAELRAIPSGGLTTNHQIQWTTNNQPLSTSNNILVSPNTTTTYKALLSDNCTTPSDSAALTITVRPALQLATTAKDSICSNETLLLTATPSGGLTSNHNIQWQTNNSTWTSQQNPATDTPQITTQYIATLTDNCSPPVQDTQQVIVLPIPKADFTANPQSGCPPLKVTLTDNSTANDSTQNTWTIGTGEYQGTTTQTHELLKTGVYNIKLNVKNALGCSDEKTQVKAITVFAKPKANFIIKPDIKEVEEALQLYNLSQNYTSVLWDMGNGNIITPQYGKDTSYKYHEDDTGNREVQLIAINNQGCRDTSKQTILLYNKVHCTIPTAFTPNGDNLNNTFKPVCVGVGNYTLTIYNRWGQVIYQQQNGTWDGMYADQPLPMGVYMYKIQINAQSKKKKLTYGTVQLIR